MRSLLLQNYKDITIYLLMQNRGNYNEESSEFMYDCKG